MRSSLALLALVGLGGSAPEEYRCRYARKVECSQLGECVPGAVGQGFLLIPHPDSLLSASLNYRLAAGKPPQIRRCDDRGCSAFDVSAVQNGAFINVSLLNGGYYLKLAAEPMGEMRRGDFVESATTFLATITYWGSCTLP